MPRTARPLEKEIFVKGQHLRNIMKVAISLLQSIQLSPCQANGSAPTAHLGTSSLGSPQPLVQVQVPKQWTSCLVILPFLKSLLPSSFNLLSSSSSSRLLPAASYPASPQPLSRRPAPLPSSPSSCCWRPRPLCPTQPTFDCTPPSGKPQHWAFCCC